MKHQPRPSHAQVLSTSKPRNVSLLTLAAALTLLTPASLPAQTLTFIGAIPSVDFGTANLCKLGRGEPAPCSQTMTLDYKVTAGGTLGTPKVLTMGSPNLDFTLVNGTTCTGGVTEGETCAVNVTFTPSFAGADAGAVQIVNASGSVLATTPIWGTGNGPQIGTLSNGLLTYTTVTDPIDGASFAPTPAVDGAGNIYVALTGGLVYMLPVGGGSQVTVPFNFSGTVGPQSGTQTVSAGQAALAVDGAGDVFVTSATLATPAQGLVLELPAGGAPQITYPFGSSSDLQDVQTDGAGDVFVLDAGPPDATTGGNGPGRILKLPSGCKSVTCAIRLVLHGRIFAMSVDVAGDVFFEYSSGEGAQPVYAELPAGGGPQITLGTGAGACCTLGKRDGLGDVFSLVTLLQSVAPDETLAYVNAVETPADSVTPITLASVASYYFDEDRNPPPPLFALTANLIGNVFVGENIEDTSNQFVVGVYRSQFAPLYFGSIPVGSATTLPLAITNTGNRNLIVSPYFESPSYKILSQNPTSCLGGTLPGRTCNVNIQFTALSEGDHTITLTLGSNGASDATVLLEGIGTK